MRCFKCSRKGREENAKAAKKNYHFILFPQGGIIRKKSILHSLRLLCALCMTFLFISTTSAQVTFSPATITSLSFTGLNFSIGATASSSKFQVYLGPKLALSKSYKPTIGPFGIMSSVMIFPNGHQKKINSFLNIDYQLNFQKAFCANNNCPSRTNLVHEYTFGYGFIYQIKRVGLMNALNIGRYSENFYNHSTQKRFKNSGYNTLIKIGVIINVKNQQPDE